MKLKLTPSLYDLLSRYCEDLSKAIALYNVAGFFLPSILPSTLKPSISELVGGLILSLTTLTFAGIFIIKGENVQRKRIIHSR